MPATAREPRPPQSPDAGHNHLAPRRQGGRNLLLALGLVALVGLVFGRVLTHELLVYDDQVMITNNPHLSPPLDGSALRAFWQRPYFAMYMPLTMSLVASEAWLSQQLPPPSDGGWVHAWIFHLDNLMLHAICGLLVFSLLRRFVRDPVAACCGALLFVLHPLQVEAVAWATETKTLLAAACALGTVNLFLVSIDSLTHRPVARRAARGYLLLATLLYVAALLAKPMAVVTPLLAIAIAAYLYPSLWRNTLLPVGAWLLIGLTFTVVAARAQPAANVVDTPPLLGRLLVAGDAVTFYLQKLLWPDPLTMDYGRTPAHVLAAGTTRWIWLAPVALLIVGVAVRRRGPWLLAAILFIVALAPMLGLIPFEFQNISTVADRYAYAAMLGPALAVAAVAQLRPGLRIVVAVGLIACALVSYRQVGVWSDDRTLYTHALAVNPDSRPALGNLGVTLLRDAGNDPAALAEAEKCLRRAAELARRPKEHVDALTSLSGVLLARGDAAAALAALQSAQELAPREARVYIALGDMLALAEDHATAATSYQAAIELAPESPQTHARLGDARRKLGDLSVAEAAYRRALELRAGFPAALRGLAGILVDRNQPADAVSLYQQAIRAEPGQFLNFYELGLVYYQLGDYHAAREQLVRAIALRPQTAQLHNDLAAVYVKLQRFDEAVRHYRQALELDPDLQDARVNLEKVERFLQARDAS